MRKLLLILFSLSPLWAASPNILLVTIDTVRADHVGCYGYKFPTTPNIDALARQGVRFSHAYTPAPITLVAHSSIFTGMLPPATGMQDFSNNRLPSNLPTIAALLQGAGYRTGASIGSMVLDKRFGLNRGFDHYSNTFDFNRLHEANLDLTERPGSAVVDEALAWLQQGAKSQPFFLWVHLYEPHDPYTPPEPYRTRHAGRPYDGEIAAADAQVGRLLDYLKQQGLESGTSVIVAGDHGEGLGEHQEKTHGFFVYDSTLRVPLVMKLAGTSKPVIVNAAVNLIDVMPTLLRHAGLAVPSSVQGRSLLGAIEGRALADIEQYAETLLPRLHFGWSDLKSVRRGKMKYIQAPRPELYDLVADPGELRDLAKQQVALGNALRSDLGKFAAPVTGSAPKSAAPEDPALVERLKSLGYVAVAGGGSQASGGADPKDRIELYQLISGAMIESQRGNLRQSVEMLDRAARQEPDSFTVHYLQGINHYRLRQFDQSVEEFKRVLAKKPDYTFAVYYLALAYAQKGDFAAAQLGFERTLKLDASNFHAEYNLGQALLGQRKPAEAKPHYERAVALNGEYAQAYNGLGETQLALGDIDGAIASFRKAVDLAPDFRVAKQNLGKAQTMKK